MDIAWIGHGAFRLRGRDAAVVMDPCPSSTGFRLNRPRAEIVTVSNAAPEFSWVQGVAGDPLQLNAPGEYEAKQVLVTGVRTPRSKREDSDGYNTAFVITIDNVTVVHLGDLGALLTADEVEILSQADVALVPTGGHGHLDAAAAAQVVSTLEPKLVIPMLYKAGPERERLDTVEPFLKEMGAQKSEVLENHVNVTASGLPEHTTVQVLTPRGD